MITNRKAIAVLGAMTAALLAGCAEQGPEGQPVLGAFVDEDNPRMVEIEFSGCDDEPSAEVVESNTAVRITLSGPTDSCEPVHEMSIQLDEPLGDRTIIDGATGDEVPVSE